MRLPPEEEARLLEVAREVERALGLPEQLRPAAPHAWPRPGDPRAAEVARWPVLHVDDVSAIPFLDDIVGVEFYQLRARVRAGDGDLYAATCPEVPGYEAYNRDRLGLGAPAFVHARPVGTPAAIAHACARGEALAALADAARAAVGLAIHPYMGSEPVWALAGAVARASGVPVHVLAPPPPVTWLANDKAHLSRVVEAAVGDGPLGGPPVVETRVARDADALAAHLRDLAGRHARVALKMTRCASAMGNRVAAGAEVLALSDAALRAWVDAFLLDKEWSPGDEVLVVSWEETTASPSTQLWIPPEGAGPPRVEGVYEQLLEGPERVFLGSIPSRLGAALDGRLVAASRRVARVFQALGYVGRCSFDFITRGERAWFVECNGRWGGTSTPMHLVDRLFPAGRPAYRARDVVRADLAGRAFPELVAALGDRLYDARTGRGRFVLYNVGCLEPYGKLDVIALGADVDDAARALEDELPRALDGL